MKLRHGFLLATLLGAAGCGTQIGPGSDGGSHPDGYDVPDALAPIDVMDFFDTGASEASLPDRGPLPPPDTDAGPAPDSGPAIDAGPPDTGPAGDGGLLPEMTCASGGMYNVTAGDAGVCFKATSCDGQPFCPAFVPASADNGRFVITQIDFTTPSSLVPTTALGSLINSEITAGALLWGLSANLGAGTFATGALDHSVQPVTGRGYFVSTFHYDNGNAINGDPTRWDPVSGMLSVANGAFSTMAAPLLTLPVFDATDGSLLVELPLRSVQLRDVRFDGSSNCIGLAKTPFNSCIKSKWTTVDPAGTPYGVIDGYLTVADSMGVSIAALGNMPLCNFIAGTPCQDASGNMVDLVRFCSDPANNCVAPDATIDFSNTPNAWHVLANFAAVSSDIQ